MSTQRRTKNIHTDYKYHLEYTKEYIATGQQHTMHSMYERMTQAHYFNMTRVQIINKECKGVSSYIADKQELRYHCKPNSTTEMKIIFYLISLYFFQAESISIR